MGLGDQEVWAQVGADLPDVDLFIGKHRKTLHNLHLTVLSAVVPEEKAKVAFLVGVTSHLLTDKLSKEIGASKRLLSFLDRMVEL